MAKAKKPVKRAAGQAEKVTSIKTKDGRLNPFEIHFNKQKHSVLGQHLPGERGKPGISKAKALKKRKLTLLRELKTRTKSNEFVDRRIGEKTKGMSAEDRLAARFAAERKKQNKQTLFNLEDNTELTHMGQTLSEIEKYEDPRSDDEGDDALGAEFVKSAHFGGGLLSKGGSEPAQSRKEWIDKMIAESKLRKYEARKALEETLEMTDQLDGGFMEVMKIFTEAKVIRPTRREERERQSSPVPASGESAASAPAPSEDYDQLVRLLTFEPRVGASDRTKTDEEVRREEAARLRQLEEARQQRMRADTEEGGARPAVHRSADDLDDGFVLDSRPQQRLELVGDQLLVTSQAADEPLTNRQAKKRQQKLQKQREAAEEAEGEEGEATSDRPPSVKLPGFKKFSATLRAKLPLDQSRHVADLVTSLAPNLSPANRAQLVTLYEMLLRYLGQCCHRSGGSGNTGEAGCGAVALRALDALVPVVYDLTQQLGDAAHRCWVLWLRDCHAAYRRRRRRLFPRLETLLLLRVCGQLFPSSDRRHPVTMPAMLLLCQLLTECPVRCRRELTAGLFCVSLLAEFTSLSGRLVPETIAFLQGVLYSAVPTERQPALAGHVLLPHQPQGPSAALLHLETNCSESPCDPALSVSSVQSDAPLTDSDRLSCLHVAASLAGQLAERHSALPAAAELFGPLRQLMAAVDVRRYPAILRNKWTACLKTLSAISAEKTTLEKNKKRPKPLRLYEPAIEENFDGRRRRPGSHEKKEHDKLVHKYKRQMRSTIREVRRDNAFVARQKLADIKSRDDERKRKLQALMSSLADQEGDFKRMKRQK
ncbi:nucleolar protein 14-like [Amphibalanus amphitrite]|uniref:nucleolar protein 14-like n=1 Tax=Amphibalanus amphitrite TaxID=1232801 RepID=UPI001C90EEB2|nr:nucleolar protein 14-like [Amphibalanus amphitrite]XP_043237471.1 nucleolar protein 14-like [Amphibalanus amphitrite]XP_043237472.1 nucleolar protein 14-like [Amphibalanus amphitrite]XP_043237473.1 nucleolar protein 14-like [Amphibalanus amphitrite]XP_043237474.1 nucleolar protein 14-like [Amphibalanus amphitrite]XP_043237476.1 nucleolar protein 14-like [Amphibalanus amphitrite]XP_043237477.1 nucleolar protein 14-like [Amphibalanus amphitrite]XP_043237478.1 nucleolar protein 14-like [Amph